jgi:hypothetical protein
MQPITTVAAGRPLQATRQTQWRRHPLGSTWVDLPRSLMLNFQRVVCYALIVYRKTNKYTWCPLTTAAPASAPPLAIRSHRHRKCER